VCSVFFTALSPFQGFRFSNTGKVHRAAPDAKVGHPFGAWLVNYISTFANECSWLSKAFETLNHVETECTLPL
jgi:thiaminase